MNVLDSSGWLEYFTDDKYADVFEPIIENDEELLVPSICFYEVYKVLNRELGKSKALDGIALMANGKEVSVDQEIALTAAQINAELKLPIADSMIYAISQKYEAELWTLDSDFEGLEGVKYFSKKS
ncbi:MAG: type II toxin-antitoxin system VapC family toxin [Gracilimonas sp.]|uniref:type II toxin-antitoxin system VapC family toxin n=1 Tax=Gracilimonas TaxID=649462 RepID=UPI001B2D1641|nr:type II toxin-antitoxin system VapC family toxin [Gracilimonas sp.]MBO6587137.1 type II toxin-antitoxin system VapC family toxin [Gracilimonas sp.]MBO6614375.1 type II toxin-antitoxin system VapC family toxin [Gracilimonas sp.]